MAAATPAPGTARRSFALELSVVLGVLGAGLAALATGLILLALSVDRTHERLEGVMGTVALATAGAVVFSLVYRKSARVLLGAHVASSLSLAAAAYAVTLERGDPDLALGVLLYAVLAPLALTAIAAGAAGYRVLRTERGHLRRHALVPALLGLAVAAVPFLIALSGDPADAPEAAVRARLGAATAVACTRSDLEPGSWICTIVAETSTGSPECEIRLGEDGTIVRSEWLWSGVVADPAADAVCRRLAR